ncbi:MAG: sodium:proton antiporter, partial [Lentisphaeria bacterium]|nr:sodium:proton antiporter [Lentisphaeria bacterium]
MKKLSLLAVVLTGVLLLLAEKDFPDWADPNSAANAGMSQHYIKNSFQETKVDNLVTALLADYRGFDTMFETAVIFTACLAIMAILRVFHTDETWHKPTVKDDLIIQTTCRILIPIIQIFALYVLFHGHVSPGGGFQAGVIFGASLILMAIAFNLETAMKRLSESKALILISAGVLI